MIYSNAHEWKKAENIIMNIIKEKCENGFVHITISRYNDLVNLSLVGIMI